MFNALFLMLIGTLANSLFLSNKLINISEDEYFDGYNLTKIIVDNDTVFKYDIFIKDDNSVYIRNLSKNGDTIKLKLPEALWSNISRDNIETLDMTADRVSIIYRNYLINYRKINNIFTFDSYVDISYVFNKSIKIAATKIQIDGSKIIGWEDFQRKHNGDDDFFLWVYDTAEPSSSKWIKLPSPKGYYWSIAQPRSLIDYCNYSIICTDITEYKIRFFDLDGKQTDSITRAIPHWQAYTIDADFSNLSAQGLYDKLTHNDSTRSQMQRIHHLDSSTIFVSYSHKFDSDDPNISFHDFYDIWKKNNTTGKWELDKSNIDSFSFKGGEDNAKLSLNRNFVVSGKSFISFHSDFDKDKDNTFILLRSLK